MTAMTPYGKGDSGISAYHVGQDFIIVQFKSGDRYRYDHETPGLEHVAAMKQLAASGRGLATYISQHVGANYAEKLP